MALLSLHVLTYKTWYLQMHIPVLNYGMPALLMVNVWALQRHRRLAHTCYNIVYLANSMCLLTQFGARQRIVTQHRTHTSHT